MDSSSSTFISVALIEDLMVNILSRLPVKPLTRFKCVSKRWFALISDPRFAKLQLQQSLKDEAPSCHRIIKNCYLQLIDPEALDQGQDDESVVRRDHPSTDPEDGFFFIGSCDGLVCLGVYQSNRYILYNPTTRLSRNIPASTLDAEKEQDELFTGLGHDPSTDDYKIIRGIFRDSDTEPGCDFVDVDIFSLKTNSWRRIQLQNGDITGLYQNGIYLNGSLHWFSDHHSNSKGKNSIVTFDLVAEKLKEGEVPLPSVMELEGLGFIGGRLFVHSSTWRDRAEAWIMKEYGNGESWTELFSLDIWTEEFPGTKYYTTPLTCTRSGKVVFDVDGRDMVLCNTQDGTLKEIRTDDADYETMVYVESLVSPY